MSIQSGQADGHGYAPSASVAVVPSLSKQQQDLYTAIWETSEAYRVHSPGETYVEKFLEMSGLRGGTVLDAGCGSAAGALALEKYGFTPTLVDITASGIRLEASRMPFHRAALWEDLAARWPDGFLSVYCCDVMEHIPEAFTMLVASRLLAVTQRYAFFSIALTPDQCGYQAGEPLHQTVKPYRWWRDHLKELGTIVKSRDLLSHGLFLVAP